MRRRHVASGLLSLIVLATTCTPTTTATPEQNEDTLDVESVRPQGIAWVAPLVADAIVAGDAVDLAVYTENADATVMHFMVDGTEVDACDPSDDGDGDADSECLEDNVWRVATTLETAGAHRIDAWFLAADGSRVTTTRNLTVLDSAPVENMASGSPDDPDPVSSDPAGNGAATTVVEAIVGPDGFLDPNTSWQSVAGGLAWRTLGRRIVLRGTDGQTVVQRGDVDAVARCMNRYGDAIRRYADLGSVSRATVAAYALSRNGCRNPRGGHNGHGWGPMELPARVCSALSRSITTHGPLSAFSGGTNITASQCRTQMANDPDFSFSVGVHYLGTVRRRTHDDPVRIAAVLDAGAVRQSNVAPWRIRTTQHLLDRFVRFYNAYTTWAVRDPSTQMPEPAGAPGDRVAAIGVNDVGVPDFDPLHAGNIRLSRVWFTYASSGDAVPDGAAASGTASDPAHLVGANCPVNDISSFDGLMASSACNSVSIVGELIRAEPGAPMGAPPNTSAEWTQWDSHVARVVRRYGPGGSFWRENPAIPALPIQAWEIWNEPNTRAFWGGQPVDPPTYARLAWQAHTQLRQYDPNARVLFGGTTPGATQGGNMDSRDFLWRVFDHSDAACAFDGVAVHPYTHGAHAAEQAVISTADLYPLMSAFGLHGPGTLWVTEFGWPVLGAGSISEHEQQLNTEHAFVEFGPERDELGLGPVMLSTYADSPLACLSAPMAGTHCSYQGVFGVDPNAQTAPPRNRPVWDTVTMTASAWGTVALPPVRHCTAQVATTCTRPIDVITYAQGGWNQIADAYQRNASPCAEYYVTIPAPDAADGAMPAKTTPRAAMAPETMRGRGPHFHAVAEFNFDAWALWVNDRAHQPRSWFDAGVLFRTLMVESGYRVDLGDTWAINEFPTSLTEIGDAAGSRQRAREAVRGLYAGPHGSPPSKGIVFNIGHGYGYKDQLEDFLSDNAFWRDMEMCTRWWGQESYVAAPQVCYAPDPASGMVSAQAALDDRAAHINLWSMHMPILANAGQEHCAIANAYLQHAYVPVVSGAYEASGYGVDGLSLDQVENYVSTAIYATRLYASQHAYPAGRIGVGWTYFQHQDAGDPPTVTPAEEITLAARTASAIAGAYGAGGGQPAFACGPNGGDTWCRCVVSPASPNDNWRVFSNW